MGREWWWLLGAGGGGVRLPRRRVPGPCGPWTSAQAWGGSAAAEDGDIGMGHRTCAISEGNHGDSSQFSPYKGRNLTTRYTQAKRALRVATVYNVVKETIRTHLTLVHIFHAYALVDTLWVAHTLS
jgi:hypothetical protein